MKNLWISGFVVFSFIHAFAQQTETREISGFSGIKVTEGIGVILQKGEKEQVQVKADGTDPSNVITEISGSYLRVHMKDGRYRSVDAKVYVTYVSLDKLSASSAGTIFSEEPIRGSSLEVSASSAGAVEIAVDARSVRVSCSSAGDVELKGRADKITLDAGSAGKIDAYDLEANEVVAEARTAGSIKLSVNELLKAQASSGGNIRYRGNPDRSTTNSTSGGSVRKTN